MTFLQRLQRFIETLKEDNLTFEPTEMIQGLLLQLAASAAVTSEKSGKDLDDMLDAICKNLRVTAHRCKCIQLEQSERN